MKFVSKNGNYRAILDRGLPAEPLTGRTAVPGFSVKFEDGIAVVNDEKLAKRLMEHPGFNRDFIKVEEKDADPYLGQRKEAEPEHDMVEIKYGSVGKNQNPKAAVPLTPEVKKALVSMAAEMAKEMAPKLAMELIQKMKAVADAAADVEEKVPAKKAGRPKKTQKTVSEE